MTPGLKFVFLCCVCPPAIILAPFSLPFSLRLSDESHTPTAEHMCGFVNKLIVVYCSTLSYCLACIVYIEPNLSSFDASFLVDILFSALLSLVLSVHPTLLILHHPPFSTSVVASFHPCFPPSPSLCLFMCLVPGSQ